MAKFDTKNTGYSRPASYLNLIQLSNSREDQDGGKAGEGAEPLCLHGRRHAGGGESRGGGDPRGCVQGHGGLGEGERQVLRAGGSSDPLDRG